MARGSRTARSASAVHSPARAPSALIAGPVGRVLHKDQVAGQHPLAVTMLVIGRAVRASEAERPQQENRAAQQNETDREGEALVLHLRTFSPRAETEQAGGVANDPVKRTL